MAILVSIGRFLLAIAAIIVVLTNTIGGAFLADRTQTDVLLGAVIGGIIGLVIAGTLFGAIAAIFQIADNTAKTTRLLEKLEARTART